MWYNNTSYYYLYYFNRLNIKNSDIIILYVIVQTDSPGTIILCLNFIPFTLINKQIHTNIIYFTSVMFVLNNNNTYL